MFLQTRIDEFRMVCITLCFYRFGCRDSCRQVYDGVNYNLFLQILVYRLVKTSLGWMPACACARIFYSQIFIWLWVEAFELERLVFPTFFIWLPSLANTCHVGTWTPKQILCLTQSSTCHPPCSLWHFLWEGSEFLRTGWPRHQNKFLNADASGEAIWLCCKWTCFHSAGVYSCNIVQAWAPVVQERASLVQACACNRRTTVL